MNNEQLKIEKERICGGWNPPRIDRTEFINGIANPTQQGNDGIELDISGQQ